MKLQFSQAEVRQSFNRAAACYFQAAELQREIGESLLRRLAWLTPTPYFIVDTGCGIGLQTIELARSYPQARVYGFDLAPKMILEAVRRAPRWFTRQHYACADAAHLPLPNSCADVVFSNLMLQWCGNYSAVFTEYARILKPEGILLFSTFGPDTLRELRNSWATVDSTPHLSDFPDMHDLGDALLQAGLSNPVMDVDHLRRNYPAAKDLMYELKTLGAHNLHPARRRSLTGKQQLQAMLTAYETERTPQGIPATYEIVYGYARGTEMNFKLHHLMCNPAQIE